MIVGLTMLVGFGAAACVCLGISATLASSVGGEYLYMTGEVPWERHPLYQSGVLDRMALALLGGAVAGVVLAASQTRPVKVRNYALPIVAVGVIAAMTYYICWMLALTAG
jgi:hypothetical protein